MSSNTVTEDYIRDKDIADLLPHQAPMVLLHDVVTFDEDSVVCSVIVGEKGVEPDSINKFPTNLGIEYMAQAIGVFAHINAYPNGNVGPKFGFLAGSRRIECSAEYFLRGQELHAKAERYHATDELSIFKCSLTDPKEDKLLMNGRITIFHPSEPINSLKR